MLREYVISSMNNFIDEKKLAFSKDYIGFKSNIIQYIE